MSFINSESNIEEIKINESIYVEQTDTNINYELWYKKDPKIKGLIIDLKNRIDIISEQQENLKTHILELARKLKESTLCETDKISITIKEILKEEIKDKKISSRWIEEILPDVYKRKYEKKKANSSLSNKRKETPLLVTDNSGKSFIDTQKNKSTDTSENKDPFSYRKEEPTRLDFSHSDLIRENQELKDAFDKTTTFQFANNLIKEIHFPKEKSKEFLNALNNCLNVVFIRFNAKGIVESIEPDTNRNQKLENVNDISNDNYT